MKTLVLATIGLVLAISTISMAMPVQTQPEPVKASECPADTDKGSYHLQGHDKVTGEPICRIYYFDECPYSTYYPADHPICKKLAPEPARQPATQPRGK